MICPKCGNTISNDSVYCYYCKTHLPTFYSQQMAYSQTANLRSNNSYMQPYSQQSYPQYNYQYNYQVQPNRNRISTNVLSSLIGLSGVLLVAISVFAPFHKIYNAFNSSTESLFSVIEFAAFIWIYCLITAVFTIPGLRHGYGSAIMRMVFGVVGIIGCVGLAYYVYQDYLEEAENNVWGNLNYDLQSGFYMMLIGFIILIISGIILTHNTYTQKYKG